MEYDEVQLLWIAVDYSGLQCNIAVDNFAVQLQDKSGRASAVPPVLLCPAGRIRGG